MREVYAHPLHPNTKVLLAAVPVPNLHESRQEPISGGENPNPIHPPSGCHFHSCCTYAEDVCSREESPLGELCIGHVVGFRFAEKFLKKISQ